MSELTESKAEGKGRKWCRKQNWRRRIANVNENAKRVRRTEAGKAPQSTREIAESDTRLLARDQSLIHNRRACRLFTSSPFNRGHRYSLILRRNSKAQLSQLFVVLSGLWQITATTIANMATITIIKTCAHAAQTLHTYKHMTGYRN